MGRNIENKKAYDARWRAKNIDRIRAKERQRAKKRYAENPKAWCKKNFKSILKRSYGLTVEEYEKMAEASGGVCGICGKPNPDGVRLAIDHCHKTGKVRGLACRACNAMMGWAGDNPALLRKMIAWLEAKTHFLHAGDLGDLLYSLPVIRAMGGGIIHLRAAPGTTRQMDRERYRDIAALLASQGYLDGVTFGDPPGTNLDKWRSQESRHRTFLPYVNLDTWKLSRSCIDDPWLYVMPRRIAKVVVNRTARYHNEEFPWKRVIGRYSDITFVGTVAEHEAFIRQFGDVPYCRTPSLLEVAEVIAGCDLFIGNQSAPLAIAHAMKKPCVVEVYRNEPNCIDPRPDCIAGWDENVELP